MSAVTGLIKTIYNRWWLLLLIVFGLTTIGSLGVFLIGVYLGAFVLICSLVLLAIFLMGFLLINGFLYIILPSFRNALKGKAVKRVVIISITAWLGILSGFILGQVGENVAIKYTQKQAEPIIQAIDKYYEIHKIYPHSIEELGIEIPRTLFGTTFRYNGRNEEFLLCFDLDWNRWCMYSSYDRKWELNSWK